MSKTVRAYFQLMKPTIILLFGLTGFSALVVEGSLLNEPLKFVMVMVGILLTAGSANALNMYFDRDIDAQMERTKKRRPLPMAQISPAKAAIFGVVVGIVSIGYFFIFTNLLAAFWSFFTIAFYVGIYTLWLKRRTPYNIVIGGAAGSTAPLIAWAAASGTLSSFAWILFWLVFLWTPAHFWALAIAVKDDYAGVNVPMLPVTHGDSRTRKEIIAYTFLVVALSFAPYFLEQLGLCYLVAALFLGIGYLWKTFQYLRTEKKEDSKKLFWISILYLFLLFLAIPLDRFLA
ncbi:MAG: heme o synthase [Oligoflexia bacterium]|nr:heme o synthase [Oligoflexia bacterium]